MGIQHLNSYIKSHVTKSSIEKSTLSALYGKIIAIDASIYLYRFLLDDTLMENMYSMLSLFRHYKIIPIFVFDGKAPIEKRELLVKRHYDKCKAEKEYNLIKDLYDDTESSTIRDELYENMLNLKKQFLRLKKCDIVKVQELIKAFGLTYITANEEADILCAKLVIKNYAYACLSEDMDLFVYGCPRVLRYFSLINQTVVIYYLDNILSELDLTLNEFKEICVISGTDYNITMKNNTTLYKIFYYFKLYKSSNSYDELDFYTWLSNNYNIINNFTTENIVFNKIKFNKLKRNKNIKVDMNKIKELMKPEGFIFMK